MFGYATDETEECMPLTHLLATKIGYKLTEVRKNGTLAWVRPDGKTQVTVQYKNENGKLTPLRVHTIVISTQHAPDVSNEQIRKDLREHVIDVVVPKHLIDAETIFHLNPSGRFVIGGPHGDAGLTGRKIIVDSYGGWGAHGGGAFSGKDPSKVDRSAAYAARWAAKSLVKAGLCNRCLIQVSYAIGVAEPLSINVETYGTSAGKSEEELVAVRARDAQCARARMRVRARSAKRAHTLRRSRGQSRGAALTEPAPSLPASPPPADREAQLRPAPRLPHPRPQAQAVGLPQDGRLRPLRPPGVRLGAGQGARDVRAHGA